MKKIYFVRHGESTHNVDGIRRGAKTELTNTGHTQAVIVAERFKSIPINIVLTSHFKRAYDTAVEIARLSDVKLEVVELAYERALPNAVIGIDKKSEEAKEIVEDVEASWLGNGNLPKGAESFTGIMSRIDTFIKIVNDRPEENIAIASHSGFGRQLMLRVLLQDAVTPEMVLNIDKYLGFSNVGITTYTIDDNNDWKLEQWNDDAHLGELK
jgi:broad specificity phosphatase PhoE